MLTTKQVLEATGISSVRTLQRWRERNLVPPPTLQRHPTGHGMTWMWPLWITHHIGAIKKRVAAGESLDEVARTLSDDWEVEAKKWYRKRYDFKAAWDRMERDDAIDRFADWVSDRVYAYLRDVGVERPGRIDDKISRAVSKPQFINDTLELLRQGCSPMLVVTTEGVSVTADFMLGSAIGSSEVGSQPVLVVPIRAAFVEAFITSARDLPKTPKFVPAMHVAERDETKTRVRKYRHQKKWGFTLK